jgi:hypothetical protein
MERELDDLNSFEDGMAPIIPRLNQRSHDERLDSVVVRELSRTATIRAQRVRTTCSCAYRPMYLITLA